MSEEEEGAEPTRRAFREGLEIALSGGGYRASAFALGSLLYLAHAGLNRTVSSIVSVSGGSITNAYVAQECDFATAPEAEFRAVAARLAQRIAGASLVPKRISLATIYVAAAGAVLVALVTFGAIAWPWSPLELAVLAAGAILVLEALLLRGAIVGAWLARTFFSGREGRSRFGTLARRSVDHVICATDLNAGRPFFFSTVDSGRLFSSHWGMAEAADVPLHAAVRASAAIPPLIPPLRFSLKGRDFVRGDEAVPETLYLSDGGVWNNLATDWSALRQKIQAAHWSRLQQAPPASPESEGERSHIDRLMQSLDESPRGGVLLSVDASAPERRAEIRGARIPGLALLVTTVRAFKVSYASTLAARELSIEDAQTRMLNNPGRWEANGEAPAGRGRVWNEEAGSAKALQITVSIAAEPGQIAKRWGMAGGLRQWLEQPERYLEEARDGLDRLRPLLLPSSQIPTTLNGLGTRVTLALIVHGYLLTREALAAPFGHEPPPLPPPDWFEELFADSPPRAPDPVRAAGTG